MGDHEKKDENGSLRELTVAPALTALLKPTAEYIGLELRNYVQSCVEEWKERRRAKNLNSHVEAVKQKLLTDAIPTSSNEDDSFYQIALFDEWMNAVQDIDPADKEISDLWQSLLAKAARGGRISIEVVSALKALSPSEAKFLVQFNDRVPSVPILAGSVSGQSRYLANSLEAKQLLERDYAFSMLFISTLCLSGIFFYYWMPNLYGKEFEGLPIMAVAAFMVFVFLVFSMRAGLARWRLTWLGQELLSVVSRVEPSRGTCGA